MADSLTPGTPWPPPDRTDQRQGLGSQVGATCAGCNQHMALDRPHVTIVRQVEQADSPEAWAPITVLDSRVVERRHHECGTLTPAALGLVVDGDLLAEAIADAVPRLITDEGAATIAANALDRAVRGGMTVVHGPTGRHRLVEPPAAPPAAASGKAGG